MRSGFWRLAARLVTRDEGQDLVEYALLLGMVSAAMVVGTIAVPSAISTLLTYMSATIS